MAGDERDIVARVITVLRGHGAVIPADCELAGRVQIGQELGGARVYIKRQPGLVHEQRLAHALRSGETIKAAIGRAGVSESWGYRLLRSKPRLAR